MQEINPSNMNANPGSDIDSQLRWRSTTNELVKFQVTPQGTSATVNGELADLPLAIAVNTQENALYQVARTHQLFTNKSDNEPWKIYFLGPEFFLKQGANQLPDHVRAIMPTVAIAPPEGGAEAMAMGTCNAEASTGTVAGTGACAARAGAGTASGAEACAAQAGAGTASGATACAAQAGAGAVCGAQACGGDACAAQACPANACGANACFGDLGLLPCPAEACFMHLGIPECPFIL